MNEPAVHGPAVHGTTHHAPLMNRLTSCPNDQSIFLDWSSRRIDKQRKSAIAPAPRGDGAGMEAGVKRAAPEEAPGEAGKAQRTQEQQPEEGEAAVAIIPQRRTCLHEVRSF